MLCALAHEVQNVGNCTTNCKFTETARRVPIIGTIKYYKFITVKIIILIHDSTGLHRAVHRDINLTVHLYLLIVTGYQKSLSGTIINSITKNSIL